VVVVEILEVCAEVSVVNSCGVILAPHQNSHHHHLTRQQIVMTQEEQFGQILALLSQNSKGISELQATMTEMKAAKADLDAWKLEVDHRVADLESAVHHLGDHVELLINNCNSAKKKSIEPSASTHRTSEKVEMPDPTHLGSTPLGAASGPSGHGDDNPHRSAGFGVVYTTLTPPSVTGAQTSAQFTLVPNGLEQGFLYRYFKNLGDH
jgi:hypothetical protein